MNRVGRRDAVKACGSASSSTPSWSNSPLMRTRDQRSRAERYRREAERRRTLLALTWTASGTSRYYDDGASLGSIHDSECKIDSITQSWAVLSKRFSPVRGARHGCRAHAPDSPRVADSAAADASIRRRDPRSRVHQGLSAWHPRERGQYTHAAVWVVMASARLGNGDEAVELFHMLNPVNHTRTAAGVERYKAEPYVLAGDVYANPLHVGRAGWSWYTGSAGWMYQAGLDSILGLRRRAPR